MNSKHLKTGDAKPAFDPQSKFRVYGMRYCPFAQRVLLVLAAKDIDNYDIVNVKLRDEKPEWYFSLNPAGTVPTFEMPNGEVVTESLIISDLLDELYPENQLSPSDPLVKAKQRVFVDRFGGSFVSSFYKYGRERTAENKEALMANVLKSEQYLENSKFNFFGGDQPAMVDYMIWPFFERLPMLYDLSSEIHPSLIKWRNKMHCVPAVKKIGLPADIYGKFYEPYFKGQQLKYEDL